MRITVVSQLNTHGGGSRFLRGLLLGLLAQQGIVEEVGLFVDAAAVGRDGLHELLEGHAGRVTIHAVDASGTLADTPSRPVPPGRPLSLPLPPVPFGDARGSGRLRMASRRGPPKGLVRPSRHLSRLQLATLLRELLVR